ncbi:MAG TPA: dienelactone hydrolase family protein [Dehalococcoidia bacterium]|nr:dienelactone hydrolase family protein [Dehalococcoidia bacterium]
MNPLDSLNVYQRYVVEEFADEYKEHDLSRRDLLRKVLYVTGSIPLTASVLLALGCGDSADEPAPTATREPPSPTPPPATGPGVTVQPSDGAIQVREVSYRGPASEIKAYLARPATGTAFPAIVIIHENRGLNEHIRDIARRYAKEGFVGLAVDLLSRQGGTPTDAAQAPGLLTNTRPEDLVADLVASVEYLKQQPFVRAGALGVTGFCFGGGYAFELAVASKDIKAAVPYYGTAQRVLDRLGETNAAMLVIYGGNDTRITSQAPQVEERLRAANKTFQIKVYDGANHAFFNDTGGSYNEAAAKDAWQITLAWFRQHLRG